MNYSLLKLSENFSKSQQILVLFLDNHWCIFHYHFTMRLKTHSDKSAVFNTFFWAFFKYLRHILRKLSLLWVRNTQKNSQQFRPQNGSGPRALTRDLHYLSFLISEPAILVMHHSMKPHPAITATLLDFMCRVTGILTASKSAFTSCCGFTSALLPLPQIILHFYPPLESQVRQGVFNSLNFIMEKRVLA